MENENKPHILLDMDGVLVNFVGGCEELFDADLSEIDQWNIAQYLGISAHEFWRRIQGKKNFWAMLKPYPWARDIVNLCLETTRGDLTIATSSASDVNCASQKVWWLHQHYPGLTRKFLIGPEKHLLAKPNHVLIDDSAKNCEKFVQYGGETIVFPQKWNGGHGVMEDKENPVTYTERMLKNFVQKINKD